MKIYFRSLVLLILLSGAGCGQTMSGTLTTSNIAINNTAANSPDVAAVSDIHIGIFTGNDYKQILSAEMTTFKPDSKIGVTFVPHNFPLSSDRYSIHLYDSSNKRISDVGTTSGTAYNGNDGRVGYEIFSFVKTGFAEGAYDIKIDIYKHSYDSLDKSTPPLQQINLGTIDIKK